MTIQDLSVEEVLVSWSGRTWTGERSRIAREVALEVQSAIRRGSATKTTTEENDMKNPNKQEFLARLAGALRELRRETEGQFTADFWRENCQEQDDGAEGCWVDVRLQALPDPEAEGGVLWSLYHGDPQGDRDGRGFWGQTSLGLWLQNPGEEVRSCGREAQELLDGVLDMWIDCLTEGEEGPPAWLL
ncbi:MAG: hypothetical protein EOM17_12795 [Synergistales bacterium]|nr:hypothetical protein [Synergistales bacterium]